MSIPLPPPVDLYFSSESAADSSIVERCFMANGIVRDEGKAIAGVAAIKAWRAEASTRYHHTVEPLAVSTRNGRVVVTGKVSGDFPGSPVNLEHIFEIEDGRIVALEIRP